MTISQQSALTDRDRDIMAKARELAELRGADAIRACTGEADITMAVAAAFGVAQSLLAEQAAIINRLTGEQ